MFLFLSSPQQPYLVVMCICADDQGQRVCSSRRSTPRTRISPIPLPPTTSSTRSCCPSSRSPSQSALLPGCVRGDHHRCEAFVRDDRCRHSAFPRHQRARPLLLLFPAINVNALCTLSSTAQTSMEPFQSISQPLLTRTLFTEVCSSQFWLVGWFTQVHFCVRTASPNIHILTPTYDMSTPFNRCRPCSRTSSSARSCASPSTR